MKTEEQRRVEKTMTGSLPRSSAVACLDVEGLAYTVIAAAAAAAAAVLAVVEAVASAR